MLLAKIRRLVDPMIVGGQASGDGSSRVSLLSTPMALSLAMVNPSSSFDLRSLVSNLYTGFIRASFSPFKLGDHIKTQGYEGNVEAMNFLYLKLSRRKKEGGNVFIPMASVYKNIIEVFDK